MTVSDPERIRVDEVAAEPWANGLGTTRTLRTWPCPRGKHAWGCRVSVAELTAAAAFSALPGIARVFTIVGAEGGSLTVDGDTRRVAPLEPQRFAGGAAVSFAPDAPTRACNAMGCACVDLDVGVDADAGADNAADAIGTPTDTGDGTVAADRTTAGRTALADAWFVARGALALPDGPLAAHALAVTVPGACGSRGASADGIGVGSDALGTGATGAAPVRLVRIRALRRTTA